MSFATGIFVDKLKGLAFYYYSYLTIIDRMKLVQYNIGKTDVPYVKEGIDDYQRRIRHFIDFSIVDLPLIKHNKSFSPELLCQKEGEMICQSASKSNIIILLDEKGKEFTSRSFSEWIEKLTTSGAKQVAFVTGGAYGFSNDVYNLADHKISLSKMTMPHQLVRLFFVEQLYRAFTIIKGIPYHND
jgi:23S rRNA (pseudouridine1915-N3)-methyltransferase